MAKKDNLNGSVDLLAQAMRRVFAEAVEGAVEPLQKEVKGIHNDLTGIRENMATKDDLKTTNDNVQSQLAQHRKDITSDVEKIVSRK